MHYMKITKCDIANGTGVRVVLWVSGCSHRCFNCQNPQTWNHENGKNFFEEDKKYLFEYLNKDYIHGITFSGGDPLNKYNFTSIKNLSQEIKEKFPNKTQWLYTGYTWEEIMDNSLRKEAIKNIDVLVDGRFINELRDITLKWKGSSNQRVIDVQKSLNSNSIVLYED